jgi:hypothetical protein
MKINRLVSRSAPAGHFFTSRSPRGFALVVALSLMVLLTVLVTGLLSLSAISLRASGQGEAAAVARNHARLGLMLALGELQRDLGPDRSISAPASAVVNGAKQPHLTGAWESWRWDPAQSPSPDYASKRGKFRGWLVSTADPASAEDPDFPGSVAGEDGVDLVSDFSHRSVSTSVKASRIPTANGSKSPGRFAWAVFDESTKAAIDLGDPAEPLSKGEEIAGRLAPPRFRADALDPALASLAIPDRLFTLETAVVPGGLKTAEEFRKRFHDFTTGSLGLLTDTANGGVKTDLTSLFEAPTFPKSAFPADTLYSSTAASAPRWNYLYDHYRKYKTLTAAGTGTPTYAPNTATDLKVTASGNDPSPVSERLIPVIAKMQILFSVVSHHAHFPDRIQRLNTLGVPKGNENHAVPHIVYEPVITLFNPYDVALNLQKLRVRVWDPPVGFRFAKIDKQKGITAWYRTEMANGQFQGLARFNIADEAKPSARKSFTLVLADGTSQAIGSSLKLDPGEVKVFSARVEKDWTWGFENQSIAEPRSFFDWGPWRDFGNVDRRTSNQFGVEAVPGWDTRAGLQTDHMSYANGSRPANTRYDFETWSEGFVSIRMTDDVLVEARAERTNGASTTIPDFQVDLLAGKNPDVTQDILRSYKFRFADLSAEISENPAKPVISRTYNVAQTIQKIDDKTRGFKKPFAVLEMAARTTREVVDDSKAWLYNNPVVEGAEHNSTVVGATNQSYDVRLLELTSYTSFPGIEIDPTSKRGYFGASRTSTEGSSHVPMFKVPLAPAASLAELIPSNLVSGSRLPRVVHPFGNSRAHPLLPSNAVSRSLGGTTVVDHSYFINDALWDRYFFSSATTYGTGVMTSARSRRDVLQGMLDRSRPALNSRLTSVSAEGDATKLAERLDALGDIERSRELATHLGVSGPFNLNSTSVDAWRAVLSSLRDREITAWKNRATANPEATPFVRTGMPLTAPTDGGANPNVLGQIRWAGYRSLDDTQIEDLAEAIVAEITARGALDKAPALSLAEFINRRPGGAGDLHSLAGLLQTAIDKSGVNEAFHSLDSLTLSSAAINTARKRGAITLQAMDGKSAEGAPSILTQGDLLGALAPIATVRGDTFKIRSYGEATDADGKTVLARAWCEATVQRVPEFVDPADPASTAESDLESEANKKFGRRFQVVAFRWLNAHEI